MEMQALRDRLQNLDGRCSGPPPPSAAGSQDPKLAELLARIARLKGRATLPLSGASESTLANRLGGTLVTPGLIVVERRYPLWHKLGRVSLATLLRARGDALPEDPRRCLFLDTETTGLAGGSGTLAFMVGVGRLQPRGDGPGGFTVRQYLIAGFAAEGAMLDALAGEVKEGDCLVTFNGKSYDLPLLAARHRLAARSNPLPTLAHQDLRHPLRRIYGGQFADCRLKTLEEQVLGHRRDNDLPGSEAPKAWLAWLKHREMNPLAEVARHNRGDVLAMAGLCHCLGTGATALPLTAG